MKSLALNQFRRKIQADEPVCGLWISLEAAAVSDIAVGLGLDWIVIDARHGDLDWCEIREHIRATVRSDAIALIYVPEASRESIRRALQLGADGIVVGAIESAEHLRSIVAMATQESKCLSEFRPSTPEPEPSTKPLVVPTIHPTDETFGSLLSVDGVEAFFCEQYEVATDSQVDGGLVGRTLIGAFSGIAREVQAQKKQAGIVASTESILAVYREAGFRLLGIGIDRALILSEIRQTLDLVKEPFAPQSASAASRPSAKSTVLPPAAQKDQQT